MNPEGLPRENVFGHTHKVLLFRAVCDRLRSHFPDLRILDVGCGSGFAVTRFLGDREDHVLGIDLFEPNIAYAQQHFQNATVKFKCCSATSLGETNDSFHVIVLADVLEHLDDPLQVLRDCNRLLVPDGRLLITIPNGLGPFEFESAVARMPVVGKFLLTCVDYVIAVLNKYGPLKGKWTEVLSEIPADLPYNSDSGHVQFFTVRKFRNLLKSAGIVTLESKNLSFLAGPFSNYLFSVSKRVCSWNVRLARALPKSAVSGWFFECAVNSQSRAGNS